VKDFEKLGLFYLGRQYDVAGRARGPEPILYEAKDLVTHAVCVGMTGSGKTGLCLALIEEAAIDNLPVIAIDPKGDLTNLLLTFPGLSAAEFAPWVNAEEARNQDVPVEVYAQQQADLWKRGLAEWGEDGARIQRLRDAAEFAIFTPGSSAGLPVSILKSFAAPPNEVAGDTELLAERVQTTVTNLLTLAGIDADPTRSREHILISTIFASAWRSQQDLDLAGLIQQIQAPAFTRVGVVDLETFFPAKDRFALAMQLNNLLAAPGFRAWLEGEPLEIDHLLYTASGRPRVAVFTIAHLGDAERMFFVSLLLNQVLGWVRAQPGTTSLRALLYMDEIFGYFPPVANPPSKAPLLTLLKQARAFGLGIVLATQNPVDLDYKGLANAGTWFLGRLQTDRDKARVLDGLEGARAATGAEFDRGAMDQLLAGLGKRVFLMHNVHEEAPVVLQTRWTLSYLRGPLGRDEIRKLMAPVKETLEAQAATPRAAAGAAPAPPARDPAVTPAVPAGAPVEAAVAATVRPTLPPEIKQYFVPVRTRPARGAPVSYAPVLYGAARVGFADPKIGVEAIQDVVLVTPVTGAPVPVDWAGGAAVDVAPSELEPNPDSAGATFAALPAAATSAKNYVTWEKDFAKWLYQSQSLDLMRAPDADLVSTPGESERDFRVRLQTAAREQRDAATEAIRRKYTAKTTTLQDRIRRAEDAVAREASQANAQKLQTAISFGATLLGAFMGRKVISASSIGRATTAARGVGRSMKEAQDVKRAGETVQELQAQLADLEEQVQAEMQAVAAKYDAGALQLQTVSLKPRETQITVQLVALAWKAD
jgi:hypothetical protein